METAQPKRIKKMYVLGALLIEQYHESVKQQSKTRNKGKRGAEVVLLPLNVLCYLYACGVSCVSVIMRLFVFLLPWI